MVTYQVIDTQTHIIVRQFSMLMKARSFADRKDMEHGAIRYTVRRIDTRPANWAVSENADPLS